MVKSLGLQADEPPLISPPAPCHSFSGEHGGATVHIVCFGEGLRQRQRLPGELPVQQTNAECRCCWCLCCIGAPWQHSKGCRCCRCRRRRRCCITAVLLCLLLNPPPQASARRRGWTMWAQCPQPSPPTWPSRHSSQTWSSAQVGRTGQGGCLSVCQQGEAGSATAAQQFSAHQASTACCLRCPPSCRHRRRLPLSRRRHRRRLCQHLHGQPRQAHPHPSECTERHCLAAR